MEAPLTFPVPLPVILNKPDDDGKGTPMPVRVTNLPDPDIQEEQLESNNSLLGFFQQFWNKEKKFQNLDKLNLKMAQAWDKFGIAKFAGGVIKGLKSMVSGLAGIGMGFFGMLTGLLAMAFFDPSGGFLASIIGMLANFLVMFINIITGLIPKLIPIIIKIIPILIKAFSQIIEAVSKMIPVIIEALVKGLPLLYKALVKAIPMLVINIMDAIINAMKLIKDKIPFLEPILSFIEKTGEGIKKIFNPDDGDVKTRLKTFAKETFINLMAALKDQFQNTRSLANEAFGEKNVRALEASMILYGALSLIIGGLVGVLAGVNFLLGIKKTLLLAESLGLISANAGLGAMVAALWALVAPILPFILLAALLIAAFVLLYVYWDEFVELMSTVGSYLADFGNALVIGFVKLIGWIITVGFAAIFDGIEWAFKNLAKLFFILIDWIMVPIHLIFDGVMYLYKQFIKIKDKFYSAMEGIVKIFSNLFGKIKDVFEGKLNIGSSIANAVRAAFSNIPGMSTIRDWFDDLLNTIQNSDVWRALVKVKKTVTGEDRVEDVIAGKLTSKMGTEVKAGIGNVIKNYIEQKGNIDRTAYVSQGLNAEQVDLIVKAVKDSKIDPKMVEAGKVDMSKVETLLGTLVNNNSFKQAVNYTPSATQEKSWKDKALNLLPF